MFTLTVKGDTKNLDRFIAKMLRGDLFRNLETQAQRGVNALSAATPRDSGATASSWNYEIEISMTSSTIAWINTNVNKGVNIAIILQFGHGTGTGGYVAGQDYINPAMRGVFDEISDAVWREVTTA